ncbi:hypothetical protein ACLB2K_072934 [Fragaria x ananassa]
MAMRFVKSRVVVATPTGALLTLSRFYGDGKVLSEEERAAENVYIKKMERERLEKLKQKAAKESAEKEKVIADKVDHDDPRNTSLLRFNALWEAFMRNGDGVLVMCDEGWAAVVIAAAVHSLGVFVHPLGVELPLHQCIDAMSRLYGDKQGNQFWTWVDRLSSAQIGSDTWLVKLYKWELNENERQCTLTTVLTKSQDRCPPGQLIGDSCNQSSGGGAHSKLSPDQI